MSDFEKQEHYSSATTSSATTIQFRQWVTTAGIATLTAKGSSTATSPTTSFLALTTLPSGVMMAMAEDVCAASVHAGFIALTLVMGHRLLNAAGRMNVQLVVVDVRFAGKSMLKDAVSVDQLGQVVVFQKHVVWCPCFLALKQLWVVTHLQKIIIGLSVHSQPQDVASRKWCQVHLIHSAPGTHQEWELHLTKRQNSPKKEVGWRVDSPYTMQLWNWRLWLAGTFWVVYTPTHFIIFPNAYIIIIFLPPHPP